jgi:hypothetical protein
MTVIIGQIYGGSMEWQGKYANKMALPWSGKEIYQQDGSAKVTAMTIGQQHVSAK